MGAASFPAARRPRSRRPSTDDSAIDLAHDLANLVQVVGGNLELIAARVTDEPTLRYLENARAAAQQLTELSRRLSGEG